MYKVNNNFTYYFSKTPSIGDTFKVGSFSNKVEFIVTFVNVSEKSLEAVKIPKI